MADIIIDDKDFQKKMSAWLGEVNDDRVKATRKVATEILRLSQQEVPHDVGMLQNSGFVEDEVDASIVGYNKVYAARLHEHPEYNFKKGRKGKFIEDPIKRNIQLFLRMVGDIVLETMHKKL